MSLDSLRPNRYPSKKPIISIVITYCLYYNEPDVVVSTIGVSTIGAFLGALGASTTGVGVSFTIQSISGDVGVQVYYQLWEPIVMNYT